VALTLGLAAAVVSAAGQAANLVGSALRVRGAAEHYRWLERQAAVGAEGERPAPSARLERGIELEGVSFGYGGGDDGALSLDELDLRLPAGAVVAVVGENGAGKTTLVKLLSGMYAPTRGRVLLDGVDLAEVDQPAYRRQLTAGFQDFMRFELPVRESVGLGDLAAADEKQAVVGALDLAGADFVAGLPQGVEQPLGPRWEQGVDLSGGQWQALAMARSMMRQAPLLAVFDEPGASLDPHAEHALFEQVAAQARRGGAQGRITLLISHRFSTVRMADLIVVLERGRVLEQGTHRELMARHGRYAELYGMQARAYR
jgi:ATP-binding cassette subfamily B protein